MHARLCVRRRIVDLTMLIVIGINLLGVLGMRQGVHVLLMVRIIGGFTMSRVRLMSSGLIRIRLRGLLNILRNGRHLLFANILTVEIIARLGLIRDVRIVRGWGHVVIRMIEIRIHHVLIIIVLRMRLVIRKRGSIGLILLGGTIVVEGHEVAVRIGHVGAVL
jgi:hypothetical protein